MHVLCCVCTSHIVEGMHVCVHVYSLTFHSIKAHNGVRTHTLVGVFYTNKERGPIPQ